MKRLQVLLVDNNDSFTYNIVDAFRKIRGDQLKVVRSNSILKSHLEKADRIIISPGPGLPSEFPVLHTIIEFCKNNDTPLLGICLGHQAIGEFFGGEIMQMEEPFHGRREKCFIDTQTPLFQGLPKCIEVGLYHSWKVNSLPQEIRQTGVSSTGIIMAIQHKQHEIFGIQFHPESFITQKGDRILSNFIAL